MTAVPRLIHVAIAILATLAGGVLGFIVTLALVVAQAPVASFGFSLGDILALRWEALAIPLGALAGLRLALVRPQAVGRVMVSGVAALLPGITAGALLGILLWGREAGQWAGGVIGGAIGSLLAAAISLRIKRVPRHPWIAGTLGSLVFIGVFFLICGPTSPPLAVTAINSTSADSLSTTTGKAYPAGWFRRFFAGNLNRKLWETPVRLPILDLATVGGGLRPVRITGGEQTVGLRLLGRDGLSYDFRPIVKDPAPVLPSWMREGPIARALDDQMAAQFPYGALVVARLLDAAGILAPEPSPVVMPNDSSLGSYRALFAGRVALFAVHADERAGNQAGFGGYTVIVNSDSMYADLNSNPNSRFDDRYYLRIRLIDLLVGDWDRHSGQWRWARDGNQWRAIPEDRDWAFANTGGVVAGLARWLLPRYVGFSPRFPAVNRLVSQADHVDHVVLNRLVRSDFLAVAREVQSALTDSVIEAAVAALPPPILVLERGPMTAALKARRDRLVDYSAEYYRDVVKKLRVFGFANSSDVIDFDQVSDSGARVRVRSGGRSGPIRFERFVDAADTREVDLYIEESVDQIVGNHDLPFKVSILGPPRGRSGREL